MYNYHNYTGCGTCPLTEGECKASRKEVTLRITDDEKWDNCGGQIVTVLHGSQIIEGEAHIKDNTVYCMSGESTIYTGISDYIRNARVLQITSDSTNDSPEILIDKIKKCINQYYEDLHNRKHGGVAQDKAFKQIESLFSMSYAEYKEKKAK